MCDNYIDIISKSLLEVHLIREKENESERERGMRDKVKLFVK